MQSSKETFERILQEEGELTYISYGYSMYPLIRQKEDILHIIKPNRPFKKGDILFYKDANDHYILHRLLKKRKNGEYILAGDHNSYLDKPIKEERILGLLKDITKKDGRKIDLEKDRKFRKFFYVHFFYLKAFFLKIQSKLK